MVRRNHQLYSGYVCSGVCYGLLCLCDLGRKGPLQGCHTLWCSLGTRKCLLVGVTKISKEVVFIHERPNDLISIRTTYTR